MRRAALLAAFVMVGAVPVVAQEAPAESPPRQDAARVVTLQQAVDLALAKDPLAVASHASVQQARAGLLQAKGAWLPSLTLNGTFSNSSNRRFDQASGQLVSESYTSQAQASYDIFTAGRRVLQQRAAGAEVGAAQAQDRAQRFSTILAAKQRYYAAAAAAEMLTSAQQRAERARQQLSFAQTRLDVGTATRSDLLRAQIEVGNADLAVVDAETTLQAARLELGRELGIDGQVQPAEADLPTTAPRLPSVQTLADLAERSAPAAMAANATAAARRSDVWSSRSQYLPTLRITGGYDWFSFDWPPNQQSWSLRLTASLPVFNGFQREASLARTQALADVAEARARDARIAARIAAENAAREVTSAQQRVEIAQRGVELAREDMRVLEERYQIGDATIVDLQTSQVALSDAEVASVRARQALATSVAQLESVLGTSIDEVSQ